MKFAVETVNTQTGENGSVEVIAADSEAARMQVEMDGRFRAMAWSEIREAVAGQAAGPASQNSGQRREQLGSVQSRELDALVQRLERLVQSRLFTKPISTIGLGIGFGFLIYLSLTFLVQILAVVLIKAGIDIHQVMIR